MWWCRDRSRQLVGMVDTTVPFQRGEDIKETKNSSTKREMEIDEMMKSYLNTLWHAQFLRRIREQFERNVHYHVVDEEQYLKEKVYRTENINSYCSHHFSPENTVFIACYSPFTLPHRHKILCIWFRLSITRHKEECWVWNNLHRKRRSGRSYDLHEEGSRRRPNRSHCRSIRSKGMPSVPWLANASSVGTLIGCDWLACFCLDKWTTSTTSSGQGVGK